MHEPLAGDHPPAATVEGPLADAAAYRITTPHWIAFALILIAATMVRMLWPERTSLTFDELMSLHLSAGHNFAVDHLPRGVLIRDVPDLVTVNGAKPWWKLWSSLSGDVHPPLYYISLRLWRELFGDSITAIRSLSALFGTLAVAAVAFAGRELAGTICGLLCALAIAFASSSVYFSQDVRMYAMAAFLVPVVMGTLLRIERLGFNLRRGVLLATSTAALMLTLYLALGICVAMGLYALLCLRGRARWATVASFAAAALFYGIAWVPFMLGQDWGSEKANWLLSPLGARGHIRLTLERLGPTPLDHFGTVRHSDIWAGYVFTVLLLVLPAVASLKNRRVLLPYLATLAAFILPTLRDMISTTNMMIYDRYTLIGVPAQVLAIVGGSLALLRTWPRMLPALVLMIYSVISLPLTFQRPRYEFRRNASFAERHYRAADRQLLVMTHGATGYNGGLLLALCRYWEQWPKNVIIADSPEQAADIPREVLGDELVVVAGHEAQPDTYIRGFRLTGLITFQGGVGYVAVMRRESEPATAPATQPAD